MVSKFLLSLSSSSSRHPPTAAVATLLQQTTRQAGRRPMGTLGFQYLQRKNQNPSEGIPSWPTFFSSPQTVFGVVHSSEMVSLPSSLVRESDQMTSRQEGEVVVPTTSQHNRPLHSAHLYSYSSPEADFTAEHVSYAVNTKPETALGYIHSAETLSFASPESDFTSAHVADAVNQSFTPQRQQESLLHDPELWISCPESASGYIHASEILSEEMKTEILASRGIQYTPQRQEVMFQEFMDTMALVTSPESASGVASSTMYLDDKTKDLLYQYRHQVDDLPKTLAEALADPRPVVITEVVHPFAIVDVNDAWVGLCGYQREEARHKGVGKLLQGPDTNLQMARSIVPQLLQSHFANVILTNYTKEGRRFQNQVKAGIISSHDDDENGVKKYFVGVFEELLEASHDEGKRMMMVS